MSSLGERWSGGGGAAGEGKEKCLACKSEVLCERKEPLFITSEEDIVCDRNLFACSDLRNV